MNILHLDDCIDFCYPDTYPNTFGQRGLDNRGFTVPNNMLLQCENT